MTGLPRIDLDLNGDGAFTDLADRGLIDAGTVIRMTALPAGMTSGAVSVAIAVELPDDGRVVFVQTSLAALTAAVLAMNVRYPDPADV